MKKIIILFAFLLTFHVSHFTYSQYSLPIRLVSSTGTPDVGEASNIAFTRYPHSYPTDAVSGITVTEIGTAGNYRCRGFTTFEYVKLWLSGVEQTWFDSVRVGDVTSYMLSNYISKTTTQTGISGTKALTGDWTWTSGNITMNKPYLYGSSTWQSDYSLPTSSSLVWRGFADSMYVLRSWMFLNSTKITLQSGYLLWGLGNTTPIKLDDAHFNWSTTGGLQLDNPVQFDSLTIKEDSVFNEATNSKIWSIHRNQYNEIDSMRLWITYYNTYANTRDSFQLINNALNLQEKTYAKTVDSTALTALDTISFPAVGQWQVIIPFEYEFEFVTPNNSGYDSLFIGVYQGDTYDLEFAKDYACFKMAFNSGVPMGQRARGQLVFNHYVTPGNISDVFYIAGLTSGICHTSGGSAKVWFRRVKVELLKVR